MDSFGQLQLAITEANGSSTLQTNVTTDLSDVDREFFFTADNLVSVVILSLMFVVAAIGNLTVFATLLCNRNSRMSRVSIFIMHLSVSDLIVAFIMIPVEIGWHITVEWKAGDIACRVLLFFRAFGFYLGSFILVAISIDRYLAITRPLAVVDAGKRGRIMLRFAWASAFVAAIPQSVIFHLETHPEHQWFTQCVTFNFFPTSHHEMAYNVITLCLMYVIPLVVIITCYSLILREINRKASDTRKSVQQPPAEILSGRRRPDRVRMSGNGRKRMERARTNTLRMTIVIVVVFVVCWAPYFSLLVVWWIDQDVAKTIDGKVQRALLIFAVSNSCVNPIVYGMFTTVFRDAVKQQWKYVCSAIRPNVTKDEQRQNQFELYYDQFKPKNARS